MNARETSKETSDVADASARALPAGPDALGAVGTLTALQRSAGNAAVGRMLARHAVAEATTTGGPSTGTADWSTQAKAEATAAATIHRLTHELLPYMKAHSSKIVRNTAELFEGAAPILTMTAITKRSDSATEVLKPGVPSWVDPTRYDAFFTGPTMTNVKYSQKDMIGTLTGTVMYVRGHTAAGKLEPIEDIASTVVHEVSHFLVKEYGEHPGTSDASSFDRYRDEFRAYWVEPSGTFAKLKGKKKAEAIRKHLVGTAGDPTSGYANFRTPYYSDPVFKAQVDALEEPEGFNLTNSIRLHRLWQKMEDYDHGIATIDDVVLLVSELPADERAEAASATLVSSFVVRLPRPEALRLRAALDLPAGAAREEVNPAKSAAINALMRELVLGKPDAIKKAYGALSVDERRAIQRNPPFMVYVDHHVRDVGARACVFAMTSTFSVKQYDRMAEFLEALKRAREEAAAGGLAEMPEYLSEALGKLATLARWTFFSWSSEAVAEYVDPLPAKIRNRIKNALRD